MRIGPRGTRGHRDCVVLAQLAPGDRATVLGVVSHADPAVAHRLAQLGFRADAGIHVVRRAPLGDPTIYRVHDTELCLRRREAKLVEVDPNPDR